MDRELEKTEVEFRRFFSLCTWTAGLCGEESCLGFVGVKEQGTKEGKRHNLKLAVWRLESAPGSLEESTWRRKKTEVNFKPGKRSGGTSRYGERKELAVGCQRAR